MRCAKRGLEDPPIGVLGLGKKLEVNCITHLRVTCIARMEMIPGVVDGLDRVRAFGILDNAVEVNVAICFA